nr:PTS transporter subunit EIIB [uncultured Pseudomonas sp.]
MFERIGDWFWNALTPDLVQDENQSVAAAISPAMLAALGGATNLKSCQPVALTRLRVELRDAGLLQESALREAGVPALMTLPDGVFHLLLGVPESGAATP